MVRAWSELGHPLRSELVALAPPYRTCASISSLKRGESLPLGSLVLGRGDTTIAVLAELTALSYRSPWAIPCLAVPAREEVLKPLLRSEEHTSELQSHVNLVCRLLLEKKKKTSSNMYYCNHFIVHYRLD